MSTAKAIPGITRGPDFEREAQEPRQAERIVKEGKLDRLPEINDPIISAAVEAVHEMAQHFGTQIDVQYERDTGNIVMAVYTGDGKKMIRRIPADEAIRMAQSLKEERSVLFDSIV
ncbi:MAG: flagellar protein FlaG [Myxococcota bacterium]|jgi:flagellar protein FlaG|nr:flagellar protein FlaG [Myxococcota bacterium]